ncbi:MAG TPA: PEP-CTERM sorting domain-containing protein [Phycisphaerae bacterium]|nr:PEP-CTERM sorting domain-containing protein [Phycisphaerae bacterium]
MIRMLFWCGVSAAVLVPAWLCGTAFAQADTGTFYVNVEGGPTQWNRLNEQTSGGNGWRPPSGGGGPWFSYLQAQPVQDPAGNVEDWPTFWNQWYYDGVYDPSRWKIIDLSFRYKRINPNIPGYAIIVVNWSTPQWGPSPGQPPLADFGPGGEVYIGRAGIETFLIEDDATGHYSISDYKLPIPYNPEWVSIDVRGYNFSLIDGVLVHECVPEPATVLLLAAGAFLAARRRR